MTNLNCGRVSLPSVIMSNVRSLQVKVDELQANVHYMHEYRNACLLAFTETWLVDNVCDQDLLIDGFSSPVRLDRNQQSMGKVQGGGV